MRVTDEMVRGWLAWARNYEEVIAYRVGSGAGRRFRVRVTPGVTRDGAPYRPKQGMLDILGHNAEDVVPAELMLTARETLVFAMGCATGRASALAGAKRWHEEDWTPEEQAAFAGRREDVREADREELEREAAEREEARQQRMAAHRRRRDGARALSGGEG